MYSVRGRTVATAGTAEHGIAQLWNPHASQRLTVYEVAIFCAVANTANAGFHIRRSTVRGTPGSTVTPTIVHDHRRQAAPVSGALLDLAAFSVQPTMEALSLYGFQSAAVSGSGIILPFPRGVEVPPGAGLVLANNAAIIWVASDVTIAWEEH